jgi:hypothetical protein
MGVNAPGYHTVELQGISISFKAAADVPDKLFDIVGLLERLYRHDVTIVSFKVRLEVLGELHQLSGVFQILFVVLFQDFLALRFAVGKPYIAITGPVRRRQAPRNLSQGQANEA